MSQRLTDDFWMFRIFLVSRQRRSLASLRQISAKMPLSAETIVGIVGVLVTLAPSALLIWKIRKRRRGRNRANFSKSSNTYADPTHLTANHLEKNRFVVLPAPLQLVLSPALKLAGCAAVIYLVSDPTRLNVLMSMVDP